jgi:fructoselysine-6-phosphate deglycase
MKGIDPEYRGMICYLIIRAVNNRIDVYLEHELRHPMSILRYYRQFDY